MVGLRYERNRCLWPPPALLVVVVVVLIGLGVLRFCIVRSFVRSLRLEKGRHGMNNDEANVYIFVYPSLETFSGIWPDFRVILYTPFFVQHTRGKVLII